MRYTTVPTAKSPTTAAATARMVSKGLAEGATATTGAGRGTAAGAGRGAEGEIGAAAAVRGAGAIGAAEAVNVGAGPEAGPPAGPPGGSVGSLMVGAAEGLGGKLIRTVSFFGWTLPVSFLGGTAPTGAPGIFGI